MVTLKQIAKECGVSIASVSKALNNAPDIGAQTAERIRKVAKEMGYSPNAAARTLKTNKSHNIGVLFEDETHGGLTHEYFSSVLNAVKNEAESKGYDITFISQNLGNRPMSFLEHCRYRNCDGVIIANVNFTDPSVKELIDSNIPVVTIDYVFDKTSAVLSDNMRGMADLVNHIHGLGHQRVCFVHGDDTEVTRLRIDGFKAACEELGMDQFEGQLVQGKYHDPRSSGLATRKILTLEETPTCIIYPDDISLLGGVSELESKGLKVPEDISIAGYDGIAMSRILRPVVTSLHQDSISLGMQAARLMVEAIENKQKEQQIIMVPGEVQPGGTVKDLNK